MWSSQEDSQQDGQGPEGESPLRLAEDQFYRALATATRRRLLYYLLDEQESTLEELATILTGWDATSTGTMQTAEERTAHQRGLHHTHLPLLAEAGLIEYDLDDGSVRLPSLHPHVAALIRRSVEVGQPDRSSGC